MNNSNRCCNVLGLDMGTSSIKISILNAQKEIVATKSLPTNAEIQGLPGEQNVPKILNTLENCLESLPKEALRNVAKIGVCGQMHGICFWKQTSNSNSSTNSNLTVTNSSHSFNLASKDLTVSNLYTWMDSRCSPEFLASLPKPDSHLSVNTGFGCATTFWLLKHSPELLQQYDYSGTIMDFVVAFLCGKLDQRPVMSRQNAAAWGYFSTVKNGWNLDILEKEGYPSHLLPEIVSDNAIAGQLHPNFCDGILTAGIPIGVALGDLQCSILSTNLSFGSAFINISTSAQIGHISNSLPSIGSTCANPVEYFPYFDNTYFVVGAALNGGNVLAAFVKSVQNWCSELGFDITEDKIWNTILQPQPASAAADGDKNSSSSSLEIIPTIFGERHAPSSTGTIFNVTPLHQSLSQITAALCIGIVRNLTQFMSIEYLKNAGIGGVRVSGSTFVKNPIMKQEFVKVFGGEDLKLEFVSESDASVGAALWVQSQQLQ